MCNGWLLSLTARTQYALSTALDLTSPHIGSVVCCGVVWPAGRSASLCHVG